ncbi:hypothetical protein ACP8VH_26020, partial [Klebsiella pneumoniae]
TPSVAEQEGQQTETEATGAPQKHHYTLNQQVGSITIFMTVKGNCNIKSVTGNTGRIYFAAGFIQPEITHQS